MCEESLTLRVKESRELASMGKRKNTLSRATQ